LQTSLRSKDAFVLRRAQIILASVRDERASWIARSLGCAQQTVRDAIHDFKGRGLDALVASSSRPKRTRAALKEDGVESLREMLHQDPRKFSKDSTLWTLQYAGEVSFEEGITDRQVSGEIIQAALERLGVRWERAKRWIESPDPAAKATAHTKTSAMAITASKTIAPLLISLFPRHLPLRWAGGRCV
jgi:transposase